jgi:dsDNA-specific endonuclease/ATPase MutS2
VNDEVEGGGDPEAVEFEFGDVLDLHSFPPAALGEIVDAWLDAAAAAGRRELRLIHGRGIGVQRERVRAQLSRDRRVLAFGDAPGDAGGWGATLVTLRPEPNDG